MKNVIITSIGIGGFAMDVRILLNVKISES